MFKKVAHILVIFVLLVSTGGITITRHYCGASLISCSLFSTPESCCGSGCDKCHNHSCFNKLTDEFNGTAVNADHPKIFSRVVFASLSIILTDQKPVVSWSAISDIRKFLIHKAGDLPAFLGSFRC